MRYSDGLSIEARKALDKWLAKIPPLPSPFVGDPVVRQEIEFRQSDVVQVGMTAGNPYPLDGSPGRMSMPVFARQGKLRIVIEVDWSETILVRGGDR